MQNLSAAAHAVSDIVDAMDELRDMPLEPAEVLPNILRLELKARENTLHLNRVLHFSGSPFSVLAWLDA